MTLGELFEAVMSSQAGSIYSHGFLYDAELKTPDGLVLNLGIIKDGEDSIEIILSDVEIS